MNQRLLLVLGLFLVPFAWAALPVVDFDIVPSSGITYQPLVFDPTATCPNCKNVQWSWGDGDANVNYFSRDYNRIFDDAFSVPGLAGYTTVTGAWNSAAGYLSGGGLDGSNIYHPDVYLDIDKNFKISYKFYLPLASTTAWFSWLTDRTDFQGGYSVAINSADGRLYLNKIGVWTSLINLGGVTVGAWHDVNIFHDPTGQITVFIDGVNKGSVVNTYYDKNSNIVFSQTSSANTVRFDDINIFTGIVDEAIKSVDKNQTHSYSSSGTYTPCLTMGNPDGNTTHCESLIISGNVGFKVYDENTKLPITNAQAEFEGVTSYSSGGIINVATPAVSGDYVIKVFAPGYPARFFTYDLNIESSLLESVYLLDQNKARSFDFYLIDSNEITYPDRLFRIVKDGNTVSRMYLDSDSMVDGIYLANLTTDYNYFVDFNTNGNTLLSYQNTLVKISNPINERVQNVITPWRMVVTDLTSIDRNALTSTQSFKVYPATANAYKTTIDVNLLGYFQRYYHFRTRAGDVNYAIQPYVLSLSDGAVQGQFTMTDSVTGLKVERFIVEFYADVGPQASVLVESPQTDSAGVFLFTTITGKTYNLRVLNQRGVEVESRQFISSSSSTYYYDLFTGTIAPINPYLGFVDVNYIVPTFGTLYLNGANQYGYRFGLVSENVAVTSVTSWIVQKGAIVASQTFTPTFPAVTFESGQIFDHNFALTDQNIPVVAMISMTTSIGEKTFSKSFQISEATGPSFPPFSAQTFRDIVGEFGMFIIWFGLALVFTNALRFSPNLALDNNAMIFILIIWALFGGAVGLISAVAAGVGVLGAVSYYMLRRQGFG